VLRDGAVLRVKEVDLERAEGWLGRYDDAVVHFGKMVPGLHSLVSVPAGMLRMLLWCFSLLTALGAAVWDALLLGAGWYLGANWERVAGVVGPVSAAVLAVALVAAAVPAIGWWGRRGG
jgi:membrane protein DedA with SNARE-associated domain